MDYLVTNDDKLRKRIADAASSLKAWTFNEFVKRLGLDDSH